MEPAKFFQKGEILLGDFMQARISADVGTNSSGKKKLRNLTGVEVTNEEILPIENIA